MSPPPSSRCLWFGARGAVSLLCSLVCILVIGIMPLALITAFVAFFVNGKPEYYALDLALLQIFRIQRWLYLTGILDRPPGFWVHGKPPRHPREFTVNSQD